MDSLPHPVPRNVAGELPCFARPRVQLIREFSGPRLRTISILPHAAGMARGPGPVKLVNRPSVIRVQILRDPREEGCQLAPARQSPKPLTAGGIGLNPTRPRPWSYPQPFPTPV